MNRIVLVSMAVLGLASVGAAAFGPRPPREEHTILTVDSIPQEVMRTLWTVERNHNCYLEEFSLNSAGYEALLHCPAGSEPYIALYFDREQNFLEAKRVR